MMSGLRRERGTLKSRSNRKGKGERLRESAESRGGESNLYADIILSSPLLALPPLPVLPFSEDAVVLAPSVVEEDDALSPLLTFLREDSHMTSAHTDIIKKAN